MHPWIPNDYDYEVSDFKETYSVPATGANPNLAVKRVWLHYGIRYNGTQVPITDELADKIFDRNQLLGEIKAIEDERSNRAP